MSSPHKSNPEQVHIMNQTNGYPFESINVWTPSHHASGAPKVQGGLVLFGCAFKVPDVHTYKPFSPLENALGSSVVARLRNMWPRFQISK